RLLELTRRDIPAAEYLVLAGGGRVLDVTDASSPVVLHDRRLSGPRIAALLDDLERLVGPLTVMVEALDAPDAPLWGQLHEEWPWPERVEPLSRAEALAGDVIKVFVRVADLDVDELVEVARGVIPATVA